MNIDHIALWADDIEGLKDFYTGYFNAEVAPRYHNPVRGLTSYFLTFPGGGAKLEIMNEPDIAESLHRGKAKGFCHIAVSVGSRADVDAMTARLQADGHTVAGVPRVTGEGLYESVVLDPEGNIVELTCPGIFPRPE